MFRKSACLSHSSLILVGIGVITAKRRGYSGCLPPELRDTTSRDLTLGLIMLVVREVLLIRSTTEPTQLVLTQQ